MVEWLVWGRGSRGFYVPGAVNDRTGSGPGARVGRPLPRPAGARIRAHARTHALARSLTRSLQPSRALMADYGNEKDHPEDNTSFNPETELNNTDATCAFKCLFEGLIVFSRGF